MAKTVFEFNITPGVNELLEIPNGAIFVGATGTSYSEFITTWWEVDNGPIEVTRHLRAYKRWNIIQPNATYLGCTILDKEPYFIYEVPAEETANQSTITMTATGSGVVGDGISNVQLMVDTENAYSRPRYGDIEWGRCIVVLRDRGYGDKQIAYILRNNIMRWAADEATGSPTQKDLLKYLDKSPWYAPDKLDLEED